MDTPNRTHLEDASDDVLGEQLDAIAAELIRRAGPKVHPDADTWMLPPADPYTRGRLVEKGRNVHLMVNDVTVVTRLSPADRLGLVAWLITTSPGFKQRHGG